MTLTTCQRCNNCCTSFGVCLTIADIVRLSKETGKKPEDFVTIIDDYHPRQRTEPAVLLDGKHHLLVLKHNAERVCTFFNGKSCGIYKSRPYLCRTYPFTLKNGELADVQNRACTVLWYPKGKDKEKYVADLDVYLKQIEAYSKIVDEWNSNFDGNLTDFLIFAMKKAKE